MEVGRTKVIPGGRATTKERAPEVEDEDALEVKVLEPVHGVDEVP